MYQILEEEELGEAIDSTHRNFLRTATEFDGDIAS